MVAGARVVHFVRCANEGKDSDDLVMSLHGRGGNMGDKNRVASWEVLKVFLKKGGSVEDWVSLRE